MAEEKDVTELENPTLQQIFQTAFREGLGEDIRQALTRRTKIKRGEITGVQQAEISNLPRPAEEEALSALVKARERVKRKAKGERLAFLQEEIADPVLRRKKEPFSVFDTAFRILGRKDQAALVE